MQQLLTEKGHEQAQRYRDIWGYWIPRMDAAAILNRSRSVINRWDELLMCGNDDYLITHAGSGNPFNPYQLDLLREINRFQYRGPKNPHKNKKDSEILAFIQRQKLWTIENWKQGKFGNYRG